MVSCSSYHPRTPLSGFTRNAGVRAAGSDRAAGRGGEAASRSSGARAYATDHLEGHDVHGTSNSFLVRNGQGRPCGANGLRLCVQRPGASAPCRLSVSTPVRCTSHVPRRHLTRPSPLSMPSSTERTTFLSEQSELVEREVTGDLRDQAMRLIQRLPPTPGARWAVRSCLHTPVPRIGGWPDPLHSFILLWLLSRQRSHAWNKPSRAT